MKKKFGNRVLDNLIRQWVEVRKCGFTFRSYEDYFLGEWIGNISILNKFDREILHATTTHAYNRKELETYADGFIGLMGSLQEAENEQD